MTQKKIVVVMMNQFTQHLLAKSFLSVSDLQSIKSNLLQQNSEARLNELISAAKYYYENDAFININR